MSYILIIFDQEGCIGVNKELSTQQNDKYDYALLLGFHGHSKTNDPLAHSFRPEFNFVSIDNQLVGELSVFIQFLECHSIEIAFISGNSYINEELRIHQYNHYWQFVQMDYNLIHC